MDVSARTGRDDDYVPITLPLHRRQCGVNRVEDPKNVDIDHPAIFCSGRVLERGSNPHPRNIEQQVQPPAFPQNAPDHLRGLGLVRHISFDRQRLAAGPSDTLCQIVQALDAARGDCHTCTLCCKRQRGRLTDARSSPCH